MGRELQKKKNKSSTPRVRQKPKSKHLNIKGNAIVKKNWDSKLTLAQNYRRLGLASKLNARSGGVEVLASDVQDAKIPSAKLRDPLSGKAPKLPTTLVPTDARIERDPETGAIIRLLDPSKHSNPLNDPLDELEDEDYMGSLPKGVSGGIVKELEEQASMEIKKRPRQQSQREEEWIEALVEKYGDDYSRMMRDRKLNPYQQSEGDLRRRVKLWKQRRKDVVDT